MNELDKEFALAFLRAHQPMPIEEELSEADIQTYDEVRKYFMANPDPECIPLFLGSFPDDSGFGVYQLVEDVLVQFPPETVLPHLREALLSPNTGVKSYAAEFALTISDKSLIDPLTTLMKDEHSGIRASVFIALDNIGGHSILPAFKDALARESEPDNRDLLMKIIKNIYNRAQMP